MSRGTVSAVFLLLLTGMIFPAGRNQTEIPLRFDHYYDDAEVNAALNALSSAYPELTRLDVVGNSEEGRPILCLTLNNRKTGDYLEKPALYVDGNIHGNEIQAGEVCLYLADYLLGQYGKNERLTALLDRSVFYIVPVVNVDGRHHFFHGVASAWTGNRSLRIPVDDDGDGLTDEDGPDDLDGDGTISTMRKRDPLGDWKSDPEDRRLMVKIKPGEEGEWLNLGDEGLDNDSDGAVNEDGEGYVDGNRNWGFNWQPSYVQRGSGDYPFSGAGIRALARFIRRRPNICVAWAFHNCGGMILRGPGAKEQGEYPRADIAVYDYLGLNAEKMLPGYRYLISWKDLYATYGDFVEWMVNVNGTLGFVGELFNSSSETFRSNKELQVNKGDPEDDLFSDRIERDRERLKFSDYLAHGELYKTWTPYRHPVYGDIEIGGWVKMSSRLPALFMLEELVHRNAAAVIFTAEHLPDVRLEKVSVTYLGNGLSRVRVRLRNPKGVPTMTALAEDRRLYPQDMLRARGLKIAAGGPVLDQFNNRTDYKRYKPELQFLSLPAFGVRLFDFLVEGFGRLTLEYSSPHAKNQRLMIDVPEGE